MYKITVAQLVVLWVSGAFLALVSFLHGITQSDLLFTLAIPGCVWGALLFYTFGWRSARADTDGQEHDIDHRLSSDDT